MLTFNETSENKFGLLSSLYRKVRGKALKMLMAVYFPFILYT